MINYLIMFFFLLGGVCYIFYPESKIASEFKKGFCIVGELLILMTGMMALTPLISIYIVKPMAPIFNFLNCDPSLFAGMFLGMDGGGAILASQVSETTEAGIFNGLFVSSTMGITFSLTIPMIFQNRENRENNDIILGLIIGMAFIPLSCILGGILCGIGLKTIVVNLIPVVFFIILMALLLHYNKSICSIFFSFVSKFILGTSLLGFFISIYEMFTGKEVIQGLMPLNEIYPIICSMGIILAGVLPMILIITTMCNKILNMISLKTGISIEGLNGMITSSVSSIPTILSLNNFKAKDRCVNVAFLVCACFALGDHLAFITAFNVQYRNILITSKLICGLLAAITAKLVTQNKKA